MTINQHAQNSWRIFQVDFVYDIIISTIIIIIANISMARSRAGGFGKVIRWLQVVGAISGRDDYPEKVRVAFFSSKHFCISKV